MTKIKQDIQPFKKYEIKIFDDYEKSVDKGTMVWYAFEPLSLMMKLSVNVTKDKKGNVTVEIRQPKKGECHHKQCTNKVIKDYLVCKRHFKR